MSEVPTAAQQLDLSQGGPIDITAKGGIEWLQQQQEVVASGDARAIRANVTVTADRLMAWYRKRGGTNGSEARPNAANGAQVGDTGDESANGNEVYRLQAEGHVHIYTDTDQVWGDQATYDLDQAVLVVTGQELRLTTTNDVLSAHDDLEYWSQRHMAVARGDAVVDTNDGRRLQADILVAYTTGARTSPSLEGARPAAGSDKASSRSGGQEELISSGKLQKVDAFGHVIVRTTTDTVTGERAVYVPDSGIARLAGHVHINRGQNQLDGSEAIVNMNTGVSRLLAGSNGRVQGLVTPNDPASQTAVTPAGKQ